MGWTLVAKFVGVGYITFTRFPTQHNWVTVIANTISLVANESIQFDGANKKEGPVWKAL